MLKKSKIKKLAIESFSNSELNAPRVKKIAKHLKRSELKLYIKALKQVNSKKTVTLVVPDDGIESVAGVAAKLRIAYPDKKILIKTDPTLIAGIKVINDDLIYEVSIKQMLDDLVNKL